LCNCRTRSSSLYSYDHHVRHVRLNQSHFAEVTPSWMEKFGFWQMRTRPPLQKEITSLRSTASGDSHNSQLSNARRARNDRQKIRLRHATAAAVTRARCDSPGLSRRMSRRPVTSIIPTAIVNTMLPTRQRGRYWSGPVRTSSTSSLCAGPQHADGARQQIPALDIPRHRQWDSS
jgi:hypothetical protein